MKTLNVGIMKNPNMGNTKEAVGFFPFWAADNGCFSEKWDAQKWLRFLIEWSSVENCLFAVVPDVVGDASATRLLWTEWAPAVKALGYRAYYVLQDGEDGSTIPSDADGLFIGGSTEYKLSQVVEVICGRTALPVHMGRVNTKKRILHAVRIGCSSSDGTLLAFGADANIGPLERFVAHAQALSTTHPL